MKNKIIVFLLVTAFSLNCFATELEPLNLTPKQKVILANAQKNKIKVASYAKDKQNIFNLNFIEKTLNLNFEFVEYNSFDDAYNAVKKGECSFLSNVWYTKKREDEVAFSTPSGVSVAYLYSNIPDVLQNKDGLIIGVEQGTIWDEIAKKHFPNSKVVYFNDASDALNMLNNHNINLVLSNIDLYNSMVSAGKYSVFLDSQNGLTLNIAGTKNKTEELLSIFSKVIETTSFKSNINFFANKFYNKIKNEALNNALKNITFDKNKVYNVAIIQSPIYAEHNDNKSTGIFPDLFKQIASKIDLKYKITTVANSIDDIEPKLKNNEIDIVFPINLIADNKELLYISTPFEKINLILVKKSENINNDLFSLSDLIYNRIGIIHSIDYKYFQALYPNKNIKIYSSINELIKGLENNEVDYAVTNKLRFLKYINDTKNFLVKMLPNTSFFKEGALSIGFQKNTNGSNLSKLFSSSLKTIDFESIHKKYINFINYEKYYKNLNGSISFLILPLSIFLIILAFLALKLNKIAKRNKKHANYDNLTELPNRAYFDSILNSKVANVNNKFMLLFIDLDGFKHINDTYGHKAGDILLIIASHRFKNCIRKSDMISRFGGDEFVIIIENIGPLDDYHSILDKILKDISKDYLILKNIVNVSASIGVAFYPSDSQNAEILLQKADKAMYESKKKGKNTYSISN